MTSPDAKPRHNRALTFEGANRLFEVVGIEITHIPRSSITKRLIKTRFIKPRGL